jgi:hypothetical protein
MLNAMSATVIYVGLARRIASIAARFLISLQGKVLSVSLSDIRLTGGRLGLDRGLAGTQCQSRPKL